MTEKEAASKRYFDKLINEGIDPNQDNKGSLQGNKPNEPIESHLSPIEALFHKHLRKNLAGYDEYCKELNKKHRALRAAMEQELKQQAADSHTIAEKLKSLDQSFKESFDLLLESFDKFMQDAVPASYSFLPMAIAVNIPSKNTNFRKIVLKPTDNAKDLLAIIAQKFLEKGNPVVSFSKDNVLSFPRYRCIAPIELSAF